MIKKLYLTCALILGLCVVSCKPESIQQDTLKEKTSLSTPSLLTQKYWEIVGTNNEQSLQQTFRFDFRPDGSFTARYEEGKINATSIRAMQAKYYVYTGTYIFTEGKLTIQTIKFSRVEGDMNPTRTAEVTNLANALVNRVFNYNEKELTLTLLPLSKTASSANAEKDELLIFSRPGTPREDRKVSLDSIPVVTKPKTFLGEGQWVRDVFDTRNRNTYHIRRREILTFSEGEGLYTYRVITSDFRKVEHRLREVPSTSFELVGEYNYSNGKVKLMNPRPKSKNDTIPNNLTDEINGVTLNLDEKKGTLESFQLGNFQHTNPSFKLNGVWVTDDSDILDEKVYIDKFSTQTVLTFNPDGTFQGYHILKADGQHRESLSIRYNDESLFSGTYTYVNGILKFETYKFDGFAEKFRDYRRIYPEKEAERRRAENFAGIAFKVNERIGYMDSSIADFDLSRLSEKLKQSLQNSEEISTRMVQLISWKSPLK